MKRETDEVLSFRPFFAYNRSCKGIIYKLFYKYPDCSLKILDFSRRFVIK